MLKIRLKRVGRKNSPSFRVVLVDSRKGPQTGKVNEYLGFYDPKVDDNDIKVDRVKHWIEQGAQLSNTVRNLFINEKIIKGEKVNVLPQKSPVTKEDKSDPQEGSSEGQNANDDKEDVGEKNDEENTTISGPQESSDNQDEKTDDKDSERSEKKVASESEKADEKNENNEADESNEAKNNQQ